MSFSNRKPWLSFCIGLAVACTPMLGRAQSSDNASGNTDAAIESLRADLRADRTTIVGQVMQLTKEQANDFWPIYKQYQTDLSKVNDDRVALIKEYATKYNDLSDTDAKSMVTKMLAYQQDTLNLRKKYFKEFSKKLPGSVVARYLQLEHRLDLLVDLQLAAILPPMLDKPVAGSGGGAQ